MNKPLIVECPSCKSQVEWNEKSEYRPFCSESCKNKDFLAWAEEEQRIPGNPSYDDILSGDLDLDG